MVVSSQHLATEAGAAILRQGGNAIDAAVAVGYAEAVVNPCCGNLGGGGFLTAHLADGRTIFLNFREMAPGAASADMYLDASGQPVRGASLYGWKAVAVPGSVMGLDTALATYGTLSRAVVMAPAIHLAEDGFVLTDADAEIFARAAPMLRNDPHAARQFLHPDGSPYRANELLTQPDLAVTLRAIADHGPAAFYAGAIPQAVAAAARAGGGIISEADFAAYHVTDPSPVTCTYRGFTIVSAPPPSSGGTTMCEILNILEGYDLHALGFHTAASAHMMAEAMRLAFFDRNHLLGDPAFVDNPTDRLLSKDYAASLRAQITDKATPSATLGGAMAPASEQPQTTHYSVMDRTGNAVAVTYTINGNFGAGVVAGGTGFLLNDEIDDFTIKPGAPNLFGLIQGKANAIAPGKRPLSSMAPTIVLKDGQVRLVVGSPGGSRIITIVLQAILNVIDHGMTPQQAVDAPRLHLQWLPDILYAEPGALTAETAAALTVMGYRIEEQRPWGAAEMIATRKHPPASKTPDGSNTPEVTFVGANDVRRPAGSALSP